MCWFVTIAAPMQHRQAMERIARASRGMHFIWHSSTTEPPVLPVPSWCAQVIVGGCSCDIYSAPAKPGRVKDELEKERNRLQKKGWSAAKIERALHDKGDSASRPVRRREGVVAFGALVNELVRDLGSVYLFAGYQGDPREESAGTPAAGTLSLQQFLESGFPPDTIITVR